MTPLEILRAAREKIATPERWTQKAYARDQQGHSVAARQKKACKWCMLGAIEAIDCDRKQAVSYLMKVIDYPAGFNDAPDRTHAEVLAAFDKAIALAEKER